MYIKARIILASLFLLISTGISAQTLKTASFSESFSPPAGRNGPVFKADYTVVVEVIPPGPNLRVWMRPKSATISGYMYEGQTYTDLHIGPSLFNKPRSASGGSSVRIKVSYNGITVGDARLSLSVASYYNISREKLGFSKKIEVKDLPAANKKVKEATITINSSEPEYRGLNDINQNSVIAFEKAIKDYLSGDKPKKEPTEKREIIVELPMGNSPSESYQEQERQRQLEEQERQRRLEEQERQRRLAEQEAERKRKEEAARQKAALDREADEKWETLKTSEDLQALSSFLSKYKETPSGVQAQARYNDESAWQSAKKEHYISSYEKYLDSKNSVKNHRAKAEEMLEGGYVKFCKQYAGEGKISDMENMYNRYISRFGNGHYKAEMQQAMCSAYYIRGKALTKSRETSVINGGMDLLKKTEKFNCGNASEISKIYRRANSKYNYLRVANRSRFFIGYSGDMQSTIGISLGGLAAAHKGPRPYFTFRTNSAFFKKTENDYFPSNLDKAPTRVYNSYLGEYFISNSRVYNQSYSQKITSHTQIIAGVTQQIFYPLYIYVGGGIYMCKNKYLFSGTDYPSYKFEKYTGLTGTYYEYGYQGKIDEFEEWCGNDGNEGVVGDNKTLFGVVDAGVILQFSCFYISGGIRTNFQKETPVGDDVVSGAQITLSAGFAF